MPTWTNKPLSFQEANQRSLPHTPIQSICPNHCCGPNVKLYTYYEVLLVCSFTGKYAEIKRFHLLHSNSMPSDYNHDVSFIPFSSHHHDSEDQLPAFYNSAGTSLIAVLTDKLFSFCTLVVLYFLIRYYHVIYCSKTY